MTLKAAVFCHNGLGDGINCIVLSQHLHLNGFSVDTFQNTIGPLQNWFPHLPVFPYPTIDSLEHILKSYNYYFVVWNDSSEFVQKLIQEGKKRFPDRIKVIYLYPSPNIIREPYYADCLTNPKMPVAENMRIISREVLKLPLFTYDSPLKAPNHLTKRLYSNRIVIHPTSAKPNRNWDKEKFIRLALSLKDQGYEITFIPGTNDLANWKEMEQEKIKVVDFSNVESLAEYLYESGYFIGNDSGPGHLASSLHLPTVTICRRKALADLWAPSFYKNYPVVPSSLIPNIRGLRLRDKYWQKFISVSKVLRAFNDLKTEVS